MRSRFLAFSGALAVNMAYPLAWVYPLAGVCPLAGQTASRAVPRTSDGHPDLQGVWTNVTLTPMERPAEFAGKLNLTDAEAAAYENRNNDELKAADGKADADFHRRAGSGENRRLQRSVYRPRVGDGSRGWREAEFADCGSGGRQDAGAAARSPEAAGGDEARLDRLRERPAVVGAVPDELWFEFRAAHAAGALQQQLSDRADSGCGGDSGRDDPRCAHYPDELQARPRRCSAVAGRFGWTLGGRHAGGGHHKFQREHQLPRIVKEPACDRAVL